MRMSCNGCRVLRKGCSEDCSIRPCLEWIKCPQSQANATLFLAKFYGRAGLINLINSASENHRPAIFRSLLHEACGRIVNPVYGSVGLLWSASWQLCQAAVEAVLKGEPITPIASEATHGPPFKAYDIRHVAKDDSLDETQRVKTRSRFRRAVKPKPRKESGSVEEANQLSESSLSQLGKDSESGVSVETSILFHDEPESEAKVSGRSEDDVGNEVGLELRLGFEPVDSNEPREEHVVPIKKRKFDLKDCNVSCKEEIGLEFAA